MGDLSKCDKENCKIKDSCLRYTSEENKYNQSWMMFAKENCIDKGYALFVEDKSKSE